MAMYNNTAYIGTSGGLFEALISMILPALAILLTLAGFAFVFWVMYDAYTDWKISVVRKGTMQALRELEGMKRQ